MRISNNPVLVDDEDYEYLMQFSWWLTSKREDRNTRYVRGKPEGISVLMRRFLLNAPTDKQVDHRDNNGLNNQRSNLRLATNAQNQQNKPKRINNTSGFKGVWRSSGTDKWVAEAVGDHVRGCDDSPTH